MIRKNLKMVLNETIDKIDNVEIPKEELDHVNYVLNNEISNVFSKPVINSDNIGKYETMIDEVVRQAMNRIGKQNALIDEAARQAMNRIGKPNALIEEAANQATNSIGKPNEIKKIK